jgi:Ca-activated chloride channel family protein
LPLGPKGDGSKAIAAIKKWSMGDLPDFNVTITKALDGDATSKGLLASDAKQKHIIVITDDDPSMPTEETIQRLIKAKITVSTITVFPHMPHNVAPGVRELASRTGGRSFGPIEDNPNQLPQIFVKEATIVRRSLITENSDGIPLKRTPSTSDMIKGLGDLPMVRGMVLTSRKNNPQIEMPLVAGKNNDPVLAHWQTGLGRAAVYTSDANNQWGVWWVGSPEYNKFWAQVVRSVARPPTSTLFNVQTTAVGDKGHIVIEALGKDGGYQDFLSFAGKVQGPDPTKPPIDVRPVQTGPGRYEATFNAPDSGTYVAAMQSQGDRSILISGMAMNSSLEMRDLQSNDSLLKDIADRTGGRMLPAFDATNADLFNHVGLSPAITPLPIWDDLVCVLIALILMDVAARRIAWDRQALKRYAATTAGAVRSFTTTRKIETRVSVDALKRIREEAVVAAAAPPKAVARPDPKARFEAKTAVEGDITKVVGGATDKPIPSAPQKIEPKGVVVGGMGSLMAAKRRAQEQIKLKEKGD